MFLLSFVVLEPFNGDFIRFIERIIERSNGCNKTRKIVIDQFGSHKGKKKHNLRRGRETLHFSPVVVVSIKSSERHFKRNTCLGHIFHRCREVRKHTR